MRKADVIRYYGTARRVAEALELLPSTISMWGDVIPRGAACELEVITAGALKVDWSLYPKRQRKAKQK